MFIPLWTIGSNMVRYKWMTPTDRRTNKWLGRGFISLRIDASDSFMPVFVNKWGCCALRWREVWQKCCREPPSLTDNKHCTYLFKGSLTRKLQIIANWCIICRQIVNISAKWEVIKWIIISLISKCYNVPYTTNRS